MCYACVVCACVCMCVLCCLGLSAKSKVCDVQHSVLFLLCLQCVMIVGHVCVCDVVCVCMFVYMCVVLCVYVCMCVCICICLCVNMCGIVYDVQYGVLFIFFPYRVVVLCVMGGMRCAVYSNVFLLS